jgi:hypothetical protein
MKLSILVYDKTDIIHLKATYVPFNYSQLSSETDGSWRLIKNRNCARNLGVLELTSSSGIAHLENK